MIDKPGLIQSRFKDGLTKCEYCETPTPAAQLEIHHSLWHRRKGWDCFDEWPNLCCLCHECHETIGNSYKFKQWFWDKQVERGIDMAAWVESLPTKIKRF
jgi:hypothetical protein